MRRHLYTFRPMEPRYCTAVLFRHRDQHFSMSLHRLSDHHEMKQKHNHHSDFLLSPKYCWTCGRLSSTNHRNFLERRYCSRACASPNKRPGPEDAALEKLIAELAMSRERRKAGVSVDYAQQVAEKQGFGVERGLTPQDAPEATLCTSMTRKMLKGTVSPPSHLMLRQDQISVPLSNEARSRQISGSEFGEQREDWLPLASSAMKTFSQRSSSASKKASQLKPVSQKETFAIEP